MRTASMKISPVPTMMVPDRRADRSLLATSLTLAAMSLVYGVVQLDVTIVNTALSRYFQEVNGLSPFATGLAFVPMLGTVLPVNLAAPRLAERVGARATIALGAVVSALG